MKRQILAILTSILLLMSVSAYAQTYTSDQVEGKANKALLQVLPAHLVPAAEIYYPPYYLAETAEEEWLLLEKGRKTKGKLKKVKVRYKLTLRHTACAYYRDLAVVIELELNSKLELVKHTGTDEIPDFVLDNKPCPLISPAEAASIAMRNGASIDERNMRLYFDKNTRKFIYSETGLRSPTTNGLPDTTKTVRIGSIRIDGETGEILANTLFKSAGEQKK